MSCVSSTEKEDRPPSVRIRSFFGQGREHDGRRGQRQRDTDGQRGGQRQAERVGHRRDGDGRQQDLRAADADQLAPHAPQSLGVELQPDEEQHEDHAEFGIVLQVLRLGADKAKNRADGDPPR